MMELLAILVIIAIVVALLEAVRRKLSDRRNRVILKIDKSIHLDDIHIDELHLSELPNGGARRKERSQHEIPLIRKKSTVLPSINKVRVVSNNASSSVPVLMDTVEVDEDHIEHTNVYASTLVEEVFTADDFNTEESLPDDDFEVNTPSRPPITSASPLSTTTAWSTSPRRTSASPRRIPTTA